MICVYKWSIFPISYIPATRSAKIRVSCTRICCPRSHVALHMIFTLIFICTFDSCHCRSSSTRLDENPSREPMLWDFAKFILPDRRISLLIVGTNNQQKLFILLALLIMRKKFHASDIALYYASYDPSRMTISPRCKTCYLLNLHWLSTFQSPSTVSLYLRIWTYMFR